MISGIVVPITVPIQYRTGTTLQPQKAADRNARIGRGAGARTRVPRGTRSLAYKVRPLRAPARSTPERGGIGLWTVVETRAVHEYQQDAKCTSTLVTVIAHQ